MKYTFSQEYEIYLFLLRVVIKIHFRVFIFRSFKKIKNKLLCISKVQLWRRIVELANIDILGCIVFWFFDRFQ